jgi:hypothetical protein
MIPGRNPHLVMTVKCAAPGCANVRRESNHWFLITAKPDKFVCRPFVPNLSLNEADRPACGQACAQKLLEQFLASTASHALRNQRPNSQPDSPSCCDRHIHSTIGNPTPEDKMQLHALNRLQPEPSVKEHFAGPTAIQNAASGSAHRPPPDSQSSTQPGLVSCVYIGLHCSSCGDVRQALHELPAGETTLCPQCGTACAFLRLGTGLTSRELPFHEIPSSGRQTINAACELPEIAPRLRYSQEA